MKRTALTAILNHWGLFAFGLLFLHGDRTPVLAAPNDAKKVEVQRVGEGELRLDGTVASILGDGLWQIKASSWTSPRGVTTHFEEAKVKSVSAKGSVTLHALDDTEPLKLTELRLGARVAVIGKNRGDGVLVAREIVLLEEIAPFATIGTVVIEAETHAFLMKAREQRIAGQSAEAFLSLNKALSEAQKKQNRAGEILILREFGSMYVEVGQSQKALEAYNAALLKSQGTPSDEAMAYNGLGEVYLALENYPAAIKVLEQADKLAVSREPVVRALILNNLANAYGMGGREDEGVKTYQRLLQFEQATGQHDGVTQTMLTLSIIYAVAADTEPTAREYLKQTMLRIAEVREPNVKAAFKLIAAEAYWVLSEFDMATVLVNDVIRFFERAENKSDLAKARDLLKRIERDQGKVNRTA
jgi:tetratricopeptide (TPR) repeat protein